jgi:uridine kinase
MSKIKNVVKRNGAVVPFTPDRITNAIYRAAVSVGGRDRSTAEHLTSHVIQMLESRIPPDRVPTVEEVQDLVEKVLIENGHARVAKAYILYREEHARLRRDRADRGLVRGENIPWSKIWHVLDWAVEHDVNTVGKLNERIARGEFADIVRETDAAYNQDIEDAVQEALQRAKQLKIIIVSGPSSSGKTTTATKLELHLKGMGLNLVTLNVDNYFFDLEPHPKDEFGDYDFETPQALDLALINQQLPRLIAGEEVLIPFYDFKLGQRHNDHTPMKLRPNEILLIDSLHGMYPDMTAAVPDENKFKLFLEPLLQMKGPDGKYIRWADLRLIRRMLRDSVHRAYSPRKTLEHWHYVRSSEKHNIIPHLIDADHVVNTGLPYELPLYRPRLIDDFAQWERDYEKDPLRADAYARARRVHRLLQSVTPVQDDSPVPSDSVLREFIGGSIYEKVH